MPGKKQVNQQKIRQSKTKCKSNQEKLKAILSEMKVNEEPLVDKLPDPMDDPLYRYRQPKLIDFEKILDPDPLFPEGNIVILMKLLKKKPIPGLLQVDYDWYGL